MRPLLPSLARYLRQHRIMPGRRAQFSGAYFDSLTDRVTEAERTTSAEIVVVIRPCSGNYRDVDCLFGAAVAWLALLFIVFTPWPVHAYLVPFEVAFLFVVSAWLCSRTGLRRWLTTRRRRWRQVRTAATAAFVEEGVTHTRARTGVLLYWSFLERHVEVVADVGIHAAVPPAEWNAFLFQVRRIGTTAASASVLLDDLRALGQLLTRHLPASEDNPDELPNRPRVHR